MERIKIAALLTVFNRKDKTYKCLNSLYNSQRDNFALDIYLTNDGCTDGTKEMLEEKFPEVHVINGDGSLFWNRGMYSAWSEAEKEFYDFFLLVNDDIEIYEDAISLLLQTSHLKEDNAIIVGYTTNSEKTRITYGGRNHYSQLIDTVKEITPCSTFNGNFVLIPRSVYLEVGKNDPIFHHAIGDSDYGLRAEKKGIQCFIAKDSCGICDTHSTLPKCFDPTVPITKRIRYLYRPGGNGANPNEFFVFRKRHYGIIPAIKTYISNHIHVIFPKIWKNDPTKY